MEREVSIVVPVYNVDKYLKKCLDSLINQTFHDYEIVLIDDGSTDESSSICDYYDKHYDFIHTFHKQNGGLSDARNFGVKKAMGKYIVFVDSDDYVRCDFIEKLYFPILKGDADIAVCQYKPVREGCDVNINLDDNVKYHNISGRKLLESALLGKNGSMSAWAKMYPKSMISNYPFPVGKLYEDMEVLYDVYSINPRIAVLDKNLYFYVIRNNSIVRSRITKKHLYGVKSCINILKKEQKRKGNLEPYICCRILMQACGHLPNLVEMHDIHYFKIISHLVRPYIKNVVFGKKASVKLRIKSITFLLPANSAFFYAKCFLRGKKIIVNMVKK